MTRGMITTLNMTITYQLIINYETFRDNVSSYVKLSNRPEREVQREQPMALV